MRETGLDAGRTIAILGMLGSYVRSFRAGHGLTIVLDGTAAAVAQ
jgi:hypothetical protein